MRDIFSIERGKIAQSRTPPNRCAEAWQEALANYFGTVDQFVVKALLNISELKARNQLLRMHPESLTLKDGILLEQILCAKAEELNQLFQTDKWTPRKIDKVLWAYRE